MPTTVVGIDRSEGTAFIKKDGVPDRVLTFSEVAVMASLVRDHLTKLMPPEVPPSDPPEDSPEQIHFRALVRNANLALREQASVAERQLRALASSVLALTRSPCAELSTVESVVRLAEEEYNLQGDIVALADLCDLLDPDGEHYERLLGSG